MVLAFDKLRRSMLSAVTEQGQMSRSDEPRGSETVLDLADTCWGPLILAVLLGWQLAVWNRMLRSTRKLCLVLRANLAVVGW